MAGLDKIIGEISASSDAIVREMLDKAKREAAEICSQAEHEADSVCERMRRETTGKEADIRARAQSAAALAKRQLLLAEKQSLIEGVLKKASEKFIELPDSEYFGAVIRLVEKNALPLAGELIFNERDRARMPANFKDALEKAASAKGGKLSVSGSTRKIDGGFVLAYEGVEQNLSVSSLFESNRELLQDKIQELLFRTE